MIMTIWVGGEEISNNDPRVQQWQLHSRLFAMLRDVLNREDVQACRAVVQSLIDADYVQPLWEKLCQITDQSSDLEVLEKMRELKERFMSRPQSDRGGED